MLRHPPRCLAFAHTKRQPCVPQATRKPHSSLASVGLRSAGQFSKAGAAQTYLAAGFAAPVQTEGSVEQAVTAGGTTATTQRSRSAPAGSAAGSGGFALAAVQAGESVAMFSRLGYGPPASVGFVPPVARRGPRVALPGPSSEGGLHLPASPVRSQSMANSLKRDGGVSGMRTLPVASSNQVRDVVGAPRA